MPTPTGRGTSAKRTAARTIAGREHGHVSGVASDEPELLQLQVGRVRFELHLDANEGAIREAICGLFRLHPSRVKFVCRGRCLEGEEELVRAARGRAVVLLLASRGSAARPGPRQLGVWLWRRAQQLAGWLWRRLAGSRLALALVSAGRPLAGVTRAFLASLSPAYAVPDDGPGGAATGGELTGPARPD